MILNTILLAGGLSKRMGAGMSKVFYKHNGKAIARYSYDLFKQLDQIKNIIVVCPESMQNFFPKGTLFAPPGKERFLSVENGLKALPNQTEYCLVHDGARPLIKLNEIKSLIESAAGNDGAALAGKVKNTLMRATGENGIETPIDREDLWETYTPQIGRVRDLLEGIQQAKQKGEIPTDEMTLLHNQGLSPILVQSTFPNVKITYPADLPLVLSLLDQLHGCQV